MDNDTLNNIIGNQGDANPQLHEIDVAEPKKIIDDTTVYCDVDGCEAYFSGDMAKAQLGRHKSTKHGIKPQKPVKPIIVNEIPTSATYLETLLTAFGIPNKPGILLSLQNNPEDVTRLKDMLRAVATPMGKIDGVLTLYKEYLGVPTKNIDTNTPPKDFTDEMIIQAEKKSRAEWIANLYGGGGHNKDTGEMSRLTQMIADMQKQQAEQQRQFNEKLVEMQKQYKDDIEKSRTHDEIQALKKTLEDSKREAGGQIGGVMDNLKEFAQSITNMTEKNMMQNENKFEKLLLEMRHSKETDELKNQLQQANSSKPMGEKMFELLDKKTDAAGQAFASAMKETIGTERADSISRLIQNGIPAHQAMQIVGVSQRPILPSAEAEYQKLQIATQELEREQAAKQEAPQPAPEPAPIEAQIKFNTDS